MSKKFKSNTATSACRKTAKAPGTRIGTLQDWRGADGKSIKTGRERRSAFRDGR